MNQCTFSPKSSMYGYLLAFIIIMGFMVGCSAGEIPLAQEEDSVEAEIVTMTPEPTALAILATTTSTGTVIITTEPTATALIVPTITATSTITLSATPAIAPAPTLTAGEEEASYQNFMTTNRGCDLPCWWGFKIGDTLEDVDITLSKLGMPWLELESSWIVDSDRMGTLSTGYADYYEDVEHGEFVDYRLSTKIEFHELDGSVEFIYVFVHRGRLEESEKEFIRDWDQYFLSSFLQRYGKPTQVYFRIRSVADLMMPPQFSVSLLYREQGLAITYHIEGVWLDDIYTQAEVCLEINNVVALELSLFNPGGFDVWGYQFAPYHDELYEPLTWEKRFGESLDAFYESYQRPENLRCIFWPSQ